jgi:NADH:ubiquinone oxidoreductase subunit 5 (subunit L)/multisubunit Na+/H+ antiporter MnhA subunit
MFIGVGVGAFTAAIFHLMTHAFFKACLFLGAGSVIHGMRRRAGHAQDGRPAQVHARSRFWTFLIATLAIAGIPAAGRLLLEGRDPRQRWLEPVLLPLGGEAFEFPKAGDQEALLILSSVAVATTRLVHRVACCTRSDSAFARPRGSGCASRSCTVLENKYYVDEFYNTTASAARSAFSRACSWFDANIIDGIVNWSATSPSSSRPRFKPLRQVRRRRRWSTAWRHGARRLAPVPQDAERIRSELRDGDGRADPSRSRCRCSRSTPGCPTRTSRRRRPARSSSPASC